MIVVAIIGLLAALAIPNFIKFQARSRQSEVKANLKAVFTAQKSYYGDKAAYCTAGDVIGFAPEHGNRYAYWLTGAPGASLVRTTSADVIAGGATTSCGALTAIADVGLYEQVGDDEFKWSVPAPAYADPGAITTITYAAPAAGNGIAASPAGTGVTSVTGALKGACAAGQCEFAATAEGNIDNDVTYDEWVISSVGGTSTAYGNFAGGEPVNIKNDVNL
jgi:type IV pilus assembly protein PilA